MCLQRLFSVVRAWKRATLFIIITKTYLETERMILRDWCDEDRVPFARMNNDPLIMEYFPRPLREEDSNHLVEAFQKHFDKHGYGMYVLERKEDGAFMGFTGLQQVSPKFPFSSTKHRAVEIAWRLDYEYWGKGYASEAARAVLNYGLETLKLPEIVAYCVHDNGRAIALIQKIGMHRVQNGGFHYPGLPKDHPLGQFNLYKIER